MSILPNKVISYDAPADGNIYGRYMNRWIKIDLNPAPIGWYLKTESYKKDDEGNNIKDFLLEPEIEFIDDDPDNEGYYRLKKNEDGNIIFHKVQDTNPETGELLFEEDGTTPIYKKTNQVPYIMEASDIIKEPLKEEKFIPVYVYADGTELDASDVKFNIVTVNEYGDEITVFDEKNNSITCATVNNEGLVKTFKGSRVKLTVIDNKYDFENLEISWDIIKTKVGLKIRGIPTVLDNKGNTVVPENLHEINTPDYLRAVYCFNDGSEEEIPYKEVYWFVNNMEIVDYTRPTDTNDTRILFECFKYGFAQVECRDRNNEYSDILRWRIGKMIQKIEIVEVVPSALMHVNGTFQFHAKVWQGDAGTNPEEWETKNPDANGYYLGKDITWYIGKKDMDTTVTPAVQYSYNTSENTELTLLANTSLNLKWKLSDVERATVSPSGQVKVLHVTPNNTPENLDDPNHLYLVAQIKDDNGNVLTDYVEWSVIKSILRLDIVENSGINTEIGLFDDSNNGRATTFHAVFTYDDGEPEVAKDNIMWFSDNTAVANIVPQDEITVASGGTGGFTWGSKQWDARAGKVLARGVGNTTITAAYTLSKDSNGDYTIFDSRPIVVRRDVVRLKINETPDAELKVPYGKQTFTVTKIYDTGEEELVTGDDTNNLEWTVTPPGAAFVDATTGEVTSLIAQDMGNPYDKDTINEDRERYQDTDKLNLTQTDVILRVDWRGKDGKIQYVNDDKDNPVVECDRIHWRIMNKPVKIQILGFDKNIEMNAHNTTAKSYSTISQVGQEQEFRAVLTYADGTTDSSLMNKTIYEGQEVLAASGKIEVLGSTNSKNQEYIDNRAYFDVAGSTKNIMWTLEYKYDEDFGNEVSDTSWKYGTQLNNILDLYTYPFIDITPTYRGEKALAASGKIQKYWRIDDKNKTSYALIAHITALKPGKGRLYCTYINDPTICDWVDFEIKKSVTEVELLG